MLLVGPTRNPRVVSDLLGRGTVAFRAATYSRPDEDAAESAVAKGSDCLAGVSEHSNAAL
jgi:hypothetical protein